MCRDMDMWLMERNPQIYLLGAGFKDYFWCLPLFGEMIQFDKKNLNRVETSMETAFRCRSFKRVVKQ